MFSAGGTDSRKTRELGDGDRDCAPPYEEVFNRLPDMMNQVQREPGPATSGKFYHEEKQKQSLGFIFCPDPSRYSTDQDWMALLSVKCSDTPYLMREGFYWSDANVLREEGYVDKDFTNSCRRDNKQWHDTRHYFLKDLKQPQRWIATIEIFALHGDTLYQFDLNRHSQETTRVACAESRSGHGIYTYYYGRPKMCFNAIYDDMPMEGRWPWPRKNSRMIGDMERGKQ